MSIRGKGLFIWLIKITPLHMSRPKWMCSMQNCFLRNFWASVKIGFKAGFRAFSSAPTLSRRLTVDEETLNGPAISRILANEANGSKKAARVWDNFDNSYYRLKWKSKLPAATMRWSWISVVSNGLPERSRVFSPSNPNSLWRLSQ